MLDRCSQLDKKKMELKYYQVDAFAENIFEGNPAKVVQLNYWLDDEILQKIAKENAVDATAFFIENNDFVDLRWFTPEMGSTNEEIKFQTKSGALYVRFDGEKYIMNVPNRNPIKSDLPDFIRESLSEQPKEVLKSRDYILVYEYEEQVRNIEIDKSIFDSDNIDPGGVAITAKGDKSDFVSRFFIPQATIFEDPVTGSLHASLIPYWSRILNKNEMFAIQLSSRQGKLYCTNLEDRVLIGGNARTYSTGKIIIE